MKIYNINCYDKTYNVYAIRRHYPCDNSLAIELVDSEDGQPFATLTTNLSDALEEVMDGTPLPPFVQAVDINNCPWAVEFIETNKLGFYCGVSITSGYCEYPLYIFDLEKLEGGE